MVSFNNDTYDAVLELRPDFPQIKVVLVISKISELNRIETDEADLLLRIIVIRGGHIIFVKKQKTRMWL